MMSEVITGSSLKTDKILGGAGNDILKGSGGQQDQFDIIKGGYGNDTIIAEGKNTEATGGPDQDIFKVSELEGKFIINDFSANDDKIDLRDFLKSGSALTLDDIITASTDYSEGTVSGLKIDLSNWTKSDISHNGSVVISGASVNDDNHIELSDGNLLSGSNFFIETLEGNGGE